MGRGGNGGDAAGASAQRRPGSRVLTILFPVAAAAVIIFLYSERLPALLPEPTNSWWAHRRRGEGSQASSVATPKMPAQEASAALKTTPVSAVNVTDQATETGGNAQRQGKAVDGEPPKGAESQPVKEPQAVAIPVVIGNAPVPTAKKQRFCDGSSAEKPCIFDMGFNLGQSSAYYLRDADARVLAVEANPLLAERGLQRFGDAAAQGRFKLLHLGVVYRGAAGKNLTFWLNRVNSKFSSFNEPEGCRPAANVVAEAGDRTKCDKVTVATTTCAALLRRYGTPAYLKVDVEGMDVACLSSLRALPAADRPRYVSKENVHAPDVDLLVRLGYRRFKVVNQAVLQMRYFNDKSMRGTSGGWGERAVDVYKNSGWHTEAEFRALLPLPAKVAVDGEEMPAWYDVHAAV